MLLDVLFYILFIKSKSSSFVCVLYDNCSQTINNKNFSFDDAANFVANFFIKSNSLIS